MTSNTLDFSRSPWRRRARLPMIVVALSLIAIVVTLFSNSLEGNFKAPLIVLEMLLTLLALGFWVLFLSGMDWARRFKMIGAGVLCIAIAVVVVAKLTRREGSYTGAGVPRLVWKWSPRYDIAPVKAAAISAAAIDLSKTTSDDFPQFLGPDRNDELPNVRLSRDWAGHPPELMWKRAVGLGWSGFSSVGHYAITMEQRGEEESTVCYDINSGQPAWVHVNQAHLVEHEGGDGPRATPTIFGGRVYTVGGLGNLDCLDGANGQAIWSTRLFKNPDDRLHYGQTCSPLIEGNAVIVTGGNAAGALRAFDRETGAPLWECNGDKPSYASPSIATLAGVRQILQVHQHGIQGHALSDGHTLWEFSWPGFMPKNSQALPVGADRVYCSTGYGIGSVLLQVQATVATNGQTPSLTISQLWRSPIMKTELSNVVIVGDYVYGLDDGWLTCQSLKTGKKKWRGEKFGHGQILLAGDLLLVQSEDGFICLLDVSPAGPTQLGRFAALSGNTCWNPPALSGHFLLARNDREAVCYRLP